VCAVASHAVPPVTSDGGCARAFLNLDHLLDSEIRF
jgi:hypothetical protein